MARKTDKPETVLGGDGDCAYWDIVEEYSSFDIRKCSACGWSTSFPKEMSDCILKTCPGCNREMRW